MVGTRTYPKVDTANVPEIEHWMTIPDAADQLGMSRQRAYGWAAEGRFKSLRKLSSRGRPIFLIKRSEIAKLVAERPDGVDPQPQIEDVELPEPEPEIGLDG